MQSQSPLALNRNLSRITLVTSLGDFVSLFAVLVLVKQQTGSIQIAAYAVPLKALGVALGGALFPSALRYLSLRSLLVGTQWISGVLMGLIALLAFNGSAPWPIYVLWVAQTVLKQLFDGARESYSKSLGTVQNQRTLQAELLYSLYGAQVIGPVISFFLIKGFGPIPPLCLDALSFAAAAWMCSKLPPVGQTQSYSLLRPFRYLGKNPALLRIFLLRSVGYWIPVGLFNYLLFSVVLDKFGLTTLDSAWTYVAIGLGSAVSSGVLRRNRGMLSGASDAVIAAAALGLLALMRLAFLFSPSYLLALLALTVGGLCNGANAVTTQSLRRKLTSDEQFPEVVGLELVVGRVTDWLASTLMFSAMVRLGIGFQAGIWLSSAMLSVLAILHFGKVLREVRWA